MKRTLTILTVLTLLTGALFADPISYLTGGDKITLNATVKRVEPVFKFYGSMDHSFSAGNTKEGGETIITGKDLTKVDKLDYAVQAFFKLTQAELARYTGKLKVTFTATPFSAEVNGKKYETKTIRGSAGNNINESDYFTNGIIEFDSHHGGLVNTIECTLDYKKPSPIAKNTDMVSVWFEWLPDATLPASDNYTATVSVTIETTT